MRKGLSREKCGGSSGSNSPLASEMPRCVGGAAAGGPSIHTRYTADIRGFGSGSTSAVAQDVAGMTPCGFPRFHRILFFCAEPTGPRRFSTSITLPSTSQLIRHVQGAQRSRPAYPAHSQCRAGQPWPPGRAGAGKQRRQVDGLLQGKLKLDFGTLSLSLANWCCGSRSSMRGRRILSRERPCRRS